MQSTSLPTSQLTSSTILIWLSVFKFGSALASRFQAHHFSSSFWISFRTFHPILVDSCHWFVLISSSNQNVYFIRSLAIHNPGPILSSQFRSWIPQLVTSVPSLSSSDECLETPNVPSQAITWLYIPDQLCFLFPFLSIQSIQFQVKKWDYLVHALLRINLSKPSLMWNHRAIWNRTLTQIPS